MGEELTGTTVAALYLVGDEHRAVLLACGSQSLCELRRSHCHTANTLYALQYDGTHVPLCQLSLPCRKVVDGQVCHVSAVVDRSDDFRIVSHLHCQ